jgi:hypothetical protein
MSSIFYYSNFCEHSKKLLQNLSKSQISKDVHFICIDKRVRDDKGNVYVILKNNQRIIMPENLEKVPALLLINNNYKIIYGDEIYQYFKPKEENVQKISTNNHIEPLAFSFDSGNGGFGIVSDQYSYLDMDSESLGAKGNGGTRQMYNYAALNFEGKINTPTDDFSPSSNKIPQGLTIEQLQQQREKDLR